jgi:hypothetical protein
MHEDFSSYNSFLQEGANGDNPGQIPTEKANAIALLFGQANRNNRINATERPKFVSPRLLLTRGKEESSPGDE